MAAVPAPAQPQPPVARPRAHPRLPEDPVAGKQSQLQWREHMAHEEEERQMAFDAPRVPKHRALTKLIVASRARYDRAKTADGVEKVRAGMPRTLEEIRRRVTEIDHWGNNSRLLPDYDALSAQLAGAYADARIAAINGDPHAAESARVSFDQHLKAIDRWLEEVASGGEAGEEGEEGQEGEHPGEADARQREARRE